MIYRVVYTQTAFNEIAIDAASFDDAQKKYEELGMDADLFFIEDENGEQIIFD